MRRLRTKVILILIILFFLLAGGSAFWVYQTIKTSYNKIFIAPKPISGIVQAKDNSLKGHLQDGTAVDFVLLGYGGGSHDGPYLTDTIMEVHIDPSAKSIILLSIPRDLWINIPTNQKSQSHWKINAAFTLGMDDTDYPNKPPQFSGSDGGGKLAEYTISQVTGLPVNNFIGIDFSGFKNTIDAIGGVDVAVEKTFTDPEYPIDGKENDLCGHPASDLPMLEAIATVSAAKAFPCRYMSAHFDKGLTHMDGTHALIYVRSRHSLEDGTDFGRAARQRNLLMAVKQKVFSIGFISHIIPFISSLKDDVKTDLNLGDVQSLINNAKVLSQYKVTTLALTDQNYLIDTFSDDGQAILSPKAGIDNFGPIRNWIASYTDPNYIEKNPLIQVLNGTHIKGLAALATKRLNNLNLSTLMPGNSQNKSTDKTTIILLKKNIDGQIISQLENEFGTQAQLETANPQQSGYDILITLGEDYNLKQGKKLLNE